MTTAQDPGVETIEAPQPTNAPPWNERIALGVFIAYLAVGFVVIMRSYSWMWFLGDDWGMLDGRDLLTIEGVWAPQNGHLSAFPVVVFGVLYRIVGLHSYLPYMAVTVVLHLTLAALLRVIMRRAGVGPWMATITAGTFVLFGTGWQNMVMAIQVSMVGSMVFGLAQLILADHDGRFGRRDALAIVAGVAAVSASSVGIPMVLVVGLAVLLRRGPRMAAAQTVPAAAVYLLWRFWAAATDAGTTSGPAADISAVLRWLGDGLTGIFLTQSGHPIAAAALFALLVVGLVLAWVPLGLRELRRRASAPLAMLVGAVVLTLVIASQRALLAAGNPEFARSSRYMAMGAALVLPAIGVAANELVRRWRLSAPVVVAILLVGVPGNLAVLGDGDALYTEALMRSQERFVTGAAASPLIRQVPADAVLDPNEFFTSNLTAGFLAHGRKIGRVPDPPALEPVQEQIIAVRLGLGQSQYGDPTPAHTCAVQANPIEISPNVGDRYVFRNGVMVQQRTDEGGLTWPTAFRSTYAGDVLQAQLPDMTLRISPIAPATTFTWCTVP